MAPPFWVLGLRKPIEIINVHASLHNFLQYQVIMNLEPGDGARLLVREKNRVLEVYALGGSRHPISVAEWETQFTRALPE